jgi:hypothetical protein
MGVREDKKRETRARLERAALELFAGRGYGRTTVEDVAAFREWSRGGTRPAGLREAVDRTASWAAEMLQP